MSVREIGPGRAEFSLASSWSVSVILYQPQDGLATEIEVLNVEDLVVLRAKCGRDLVHAGFDDGLVKEKSLRRDLCASCNVSSAAPVLSVIDRLVSPGLVGAT